MDSGNSGDGLAGEFEELLQFCARAETLIAELLLLSDRVPSQFLDPRFDPVLFDLRYFESPRDYEARINASAELQALEDELNESCASYLQRFFLLANGVVQYHTELGKYLSNLQEGLCVHFTLEGILENKQGSQLLIESISLFGCLILLIEHKISGYLREKLLISYLRTNQTFKHQNLDQICSLCRLHKSTKPISDIINIQMTEELFARFPFPKAVIDAVIISCLRGDDMYSNNRFFTDPIHRTMALSRQGGHLFVLLFYSNGFLFDSAFMREVVDRFFKDNWLVPVVVHFSVDLLVTWDPYREAKAALVECISPTFMRDRCTYHCMKVENLIKELDSAVCDGALRKEFLMENSQHLLSLIKNCNFTLRWLLLHRMSIDKKAREVVMTVCTAYQVDKETLLDLLFKTSKVEYNLKGMYTKLLSDREVMWHEKKHFVSECINDLSQNHFTTSALSSKFKNKTIKEWFGNILSEVDLLEYSGGIGSSNRGIYRIISTLKDLEHIQEHNIQTKDVLLKAQKSLHDMIKILSLDNQAILALHVVTDALYAWGCLENFQECLKNKIIKDTSVLLVLNAFFLKFRSLLSAPLQRTVECNSQDLVCISNYYSMKYSAQILAILKIIPVILLDIRLYEENLRPFHLQSNHINKETIEDFIQVDELLKGARQAAKLCVIGQGIQLMSRTFDGIVNLNLKRWLEEKLKEEVARQLDIKLGSFLLSSHEKNDLERCLHLLFTYMALQSQKLELLQDILHMHGTHLWDEPFTSVLDACAIREETELKIQQALDFKNLIPNPKSFMGLLLQKVIWLTDPSRSMFIEPMLGWFDAEGNEVIGLHFFTVLESCIGQVGLASLDSLLATLVSISLEDILNSFNGLLDFKFHKEMQKLEEILGSPASIPLLGLPSYNNMVHMCSGAWELLADKFAIIGQLQLLRTLVNFRLKSKNKCNNMAVSATDAFLSTVSLQRNNAVEVQENKENSTKDLLLSALNHQSKFCGLVRPFDSTYISKKPPKFLSRCASLLSISQLCRYVFDAHLGTLTSRSKKSLKDFSPLIIGLGTLLRQFHPSYMIQYIQFMAQYIHTTEASFVAIDEPNKTNTNHACEVAKAVFWLQSFCKYFGISEDVIELCLAPAIIALLQF
ncbi:hypothetical protein LUZ61_000921 [Rhynchospora tenuis]|uniref:Uncharacterized protein n=1 Tax=Rhynchospora tenuis TaxID=198213 RepID=A0AAD5ZFX9_9POAL|nr:hypothetical protein LUZ61_000921 [Rhynchospora tenuis]